MRYFLIGLAAGAASTGVGLLVGLAWDWRLTVVITVAIVVDGVLTEAAS